MNEILINIISVVVTSIVLPLLSIAGAKLVQLINSKIKNNKAANFLSTATTIIINAVRSVFQTYVEALKKEDKFDEASQKIALLKARDIALNQMTDDVKNYITSTYGDLDTWINTNIEATINILKNK
nr:MAG TPA: holin [Caudoviricetes sp.]